MLRENKRNARAYLVDPEVMDWSFVSDLLTWRLPWWRSASPVRCRHATARMKTYSTSKCANHLTNQQKDIIGGAELSLSFHTHSWHVFSSSSTVCGLWMWSFFTSNIATLDWFFLQLFHPSPPLPPACSFKVKCTTPYPQFPDRVLDPDQHFCLSITGSALFLKAGTRSATKKESQLLL